MSDSLTIPCDVSTIRDGSTMRGCMISCGVEVPAVHMHIALLSHQLRPPILMITQRIESLLQEMLLEIEATGLSLCASEGYTHR